MATDIKDLRWLLTSKDPQTGATAKFTCPCCGKSGKYRRYWDTYTQNWLPETFGRCDRVNGCGYDHPPTFEEVTGRPPRPYRQTLTRSGSLTQTHRQTQTQPQPPTPEVCTYDFIEDLAKAINFQSYTLRDYLCEMIPTAGEVLADYLVTGYEIGSAWACYWYTDGRGHVSDGRLIAYGTDGHRLRSGYNADWHRARQSRSNPLTPARSPKYLFGLHNVTEGARVLIVESEKTAIVVEAAQRSGLRPRKYDYILATGGSEFLRCTLINSAPVLKELNVTCTLSPDNDEAGRKWITNRSRYEAEAGILLSVDLETTASGYPEKTDLADIILSSLAPADLPDRAETGQIEAIGSQVAQSPDQIPEAATEPPQAIQTPEAPKLTPAQQWLVFCGFPADWQPPQYVERETQLLPF